MNSHKQQWIHRDWCRQGIKADVGIWTHYETCARTMYWPDWRKWLLWLVFRGRFVVFCCPLMTLAVLQKQAPIKINEARLILIHSRRRLMGEASERDDYDCPWPMTNGTALCSQAGRFLSVGIKTLSGYHRGHQRHHHCHLLFVACSSCCTWCWLYVKWARLHTNQGHYDISEMFSNNSAHCHLCNNRQLVISLIALQG